MPLTTTVTYDGSTSEDSDELWETLREAHERDLTSEYIVLISSIKDIKHDTRYHLRACEYLHITRNGETTETVEGSALFHHGETKEVFNGTYNVTKGTYNYKIMGGGPLGFMTGFGLSVYIGVYTSDMKGYSVMLSMSKTIITAGGEVLTNVGMKLSLSLINTKIYVGLLTSITGVHVNLTLSGYRKIKKQTSTILIRKEKGTEVEQKSTLPGPVPPAEVEEESAYAEPPSETEVESAYSVPEDEVSPETPEPSYYLLESDNIVEEFDGGYAIM